MKIRTVTVAFTALLCMCVMPLCAQEAYNNFLKFKIDLYNAESKEAIQNYIEVYRKKIEASNLNEEEKLTLFTLLTVEQTDMADKANAKQNGLCAY